MYSIIIYFADTEILTLVLFLGKHFVGVCMVRFMIPSGFIIKMNWIENY